MHPRALVNLANALSLDQPERAGAFYARALERDPKYAPAHQGLCTLAASFGDRAIAARHRELGFRGHAFVRRPYSGATAPIPVIALVSTNGGNLALETILDERVFLTHELFVEAYAGEPLPHHAVMVNAIGDADRGAEALAAAQAFTAGRRVLNVPAAVLATERVANAARLAQLSDVVAPRVRRIARQAAPHRPLHRPLIAARARLSHGAPHPPR